jgi:hypothetical protein
MQASRFAFVILPEAMPITFSEISRQRNGEILSFLSEVFGLASLPPNLSPKVQEWKYFAPHPWWPAGRSYVLETESGIAAHGCIAPARFAAAGAVLESMVIIDWASGKIIPGAGLLLYRRCMEVRRTSLLGVGGSTDTLRILPQVRWFVPQADLQWFAMSLRPWRRFLRSKRGARDGFKFLRNLHWSLFCSLPAAGDWTCRPACPTDPVFTPQGDFVPILRTRPWIDYLSQCPAVDCCLWILEHAGVPRGHALIANLAGSARVADFALGDQSAPEMPTQAFSALVRTLAADEHLIELVAGSSLSEDIRAFRACGMRSRRRSAVLLADTRREFPAQSVIEIKPMLGDGFYLHDPANPFQL